MNDQGKSNVPAFWHSRVEQIAALGERMEVGQAKQVATSAEGRAVWAWSFGPEAGVSSRTANYPSAISSGAVEVYRGQSEEHPPTLLIVAGVHGAETEAIVACANLAQVLETGRDLAGAERPDLTSAAEGVRVVMVPIANPDGRARVEIDSLRGMTLDDLRYWGQGHWSDGTPVGWPECKRYYPLPMDRVSFPGGYVNGDGYNLMYDIVPGDLRTDEAKGLLRLAASEAPDVMLNDHSCQYGGGILAPKQWLPEAMQQRVIDFSRRVHQALDEADLRPNDYGQTPSPLLDLTVALTLASGCLPLTFEGPHGLAEKPYTHEEILETHLVLFREAMALAKRSAP
jgi:zinc carboxypeptidase